MSDVTDEELIADCSMALGPRVRELAVRFEQRNAEIARLNARWDKLREWLHEFPGEEAPGWAVLDKMNELAGTAPEEEQHGD